MTLDIPEDDGVYERDGFEVTVERVEPEPDDTFGRDRRYDAFKVLGDSAVDVYEDEDGDYWLTHRSGQETEDAILVSQRNELWGVINDVVQDEGTPLSEQKA